MSLPPRHSCSNFEASLDHWFDLSAAEREDLAHEARACAECLPHLEAQLLLAGAVDEAALELEALRYEGPGLERRSTPRETRTPASAGPTSGAATWAWAAAAAVLVSLAALWWFRVGAPDASPPPTAAASGLGVTAPAPPESMPPAQLPPAVVEEIQEDRRALDAWLERSVARAALSTEPVAEAVRSVRRAGARIETPRRPPGLRFAIPARPTRPASASALEEIGMGDER